MLLERFYTAHEIASSYDIDYKALYQSGKRAVLFDIDNTLVPHGAPADDRAKKLFHELHEIGFQTLLLSNNKEPRVKSFSDDVNSKYLYRSGKPNPKGYRRAMELLGTTPETTVFVGDQLFTDIWGAKRSGILSYLVKPIHPKEEIQIVIKRYAEWFVLYFYHKSKSAEK